MSITIGELFAGRKLHQDTRSGVARYVPGQHKVRKVSTTDAVATYVDRDGCVCILPLELVDDEWINRKMVVRISMVHAEVRAMPVSSRIPEEVMYLLTTKKQPRRPADQTT